MAVTLVHSGGIFGKRSCVGNDGLHEEKKPWRLNRGHKTQSSGRVLPPVPGATAEKKRWLVPVSTSAFDGNGLIQAWLGTRASPAQKTERTTDASGGGTSKAREKRKSKRDRKESNGQRIRYSKALPQREQNTGRSCAQGHTGLKGQPSGLVVKTRGWLTQGRWLAETRRAASQ